MSILQAASRPSENGCYGLALGDSDIEKSWKSKMRIAASQQLIALPSPPLHGSHPLPSSFHQLISTVHILGRAACPAMSLASRPTHLIHPDNSSTAHHGVSNSSVRSDPARQKSGVRGMEASAVDEDLEMKRQPYIHVRFCRTGLFELC